MRPRVLLVALAVVAAALGSTPASSAAAVPGDEWTLHDAPGGSWMALTYGAGRFVAVAVTGEVMSSPDGATWSLQQVASHPWVDVVYGNGLFLAGATDGALLTSPDGTSWTAQHLPAGQVVRNLLFADGSFNLYGDPVQRSTDAVHWTILGSADGDFWEDMAYGAGRFVRVWYYAPGQSSTDFVHWTAAPVLDREWRQVVFGDGRFVLLTASPGISLSPDVVATSPDGVTWTAGTAYGGHWGAMAYGAGRFLALSGDSGDGIMSSVDGGTWTLRPSPFDVSWSHLAYGNGRFVALGARHSMTSGELLPPETTTTTSSTAPTMASTSTTASAPTTTAAVESVEPAEPVAVAPVFTG